MTRSSLNQAGPGFFPHRGLNQRHKLSTTGKHLLLEDGLKCDYSSPLTRAKLCEIALALNPVVKDLDFNTADGGQAVQLKAVEVIRKCCLDLIKVATQIHTIGRNYEL